MVPPEPQVCRLNSLNWRCLAQTSPNFLWMLVGQLIVHVGVGLSALATDHVSPLWWYVQKLVPFTVLGAGHLIIAAMMLLGLTYRSSIGRAALLLSVFAYLLQVCLLLAGVVRACLSEAIPDLPFEAPVYSLGLVILSASSYWEAAGIRTGREVR